jgi:hypothetical protein
MKIMNALIKTILHLVSSGLLITRFFTHLLNNNPGDSLWILFLTISIAMVYWLLAALLSDINTSELREYNKTAFEKFVRQARNISRNRELLPEVAYIQPARTIFVNN